MKDNGEPSFLPPPDLYRDLRSLSGKAEAQKLEYALFNHIYASEGMIQEAKKAGQREVEFIRRIYRSQLKRIADGLAWRYFGHDKFSLKIFAAYPPPGFMFGKKGVEAERLQLNELKKLDSVDFVIQNDITNILRSGDLTVCSGPVMYPIEVKSGGVASFLTERAKRQTDRREAVLQYIATGATSHESLLAGNAGPRRHVSISAADTFYWPALNELFESSKVLGSTWTVVDDGVIFIGWYERDIEEAITQAMREIVTKSGWDEPHMMTSQLSQQLKPHEGDLMRFTTPVTVFDVNEAVVGELMNGRFDMCMLVDVKRVAKLFADRGYSAGCDRGRWTMEVVGSEWKLEVGLNPWNEVLYGLKTVGSFVDSIIKAFEEGRSAAANRPHVP